MIGDIHIEVRPVAYPDGTIGMETVAVTSVKLGGPGSLLVGDLVLGIVKHKDQTMYLVPYGT